MVYAGRRALSLRYVAELLMDFDTFYLIPYCFYSGTSTLTEFAMQGPEPRKHYFAKGVGLKICS